MRPVKNILMIAVDDLRPELGCFGKQKLHTPNIDRLAARSMRYDRAYCNYPQCMPSRVSVLTGKRPPFWCDKVGQLAGEGEPTLPGYLREQGMKTFSVGKVYHTPLDDEASWDELHKETFRLCPDGKTKQWFWDYQHPDNVAKSYVAHDQIGYPEIEKVWEPLPPMSECMDAPDEGYIDHKVASRAIDCIERHRDGGQGLFLAVGFYRPHLPWTAPKKYWDLYDREEIDLADNPFFPKDGIGKSTLCDFMHYGDQEIQETYSDFGRYEDEDFPVLSEAKQRECIHAYWACVSFMDAQVGRVLDALEANGMADDTAIILWGDNGWHLGEHKLWSKITNFDESTRVPLLCAVPGKAGGVYAAPVELVDIYPTCCDLLGLPRPAHVEGEDLPMEKESTRTHATAYVANHGVRTLVTERYRLSYYPESVQNTIQGRGQIELFDHREDPKENVNVGRDPAYGEIVERLLEQLEWVYHLEK